jgi:glutamate-1-semialdehyde 2,1-aminomutase
MFSACALGESRLKSPPSANVGFGGCASGLMKAVSRFFSQNGVVLPNGASACLSTPMRDIDAELIVQVFDRFLDTQAGLLDQLESRS